MRTSSTHQELRVFFFFLFFFFYKYFTSHECVLCVHTTFIFTQIHSIKFFFFEHPHRRHRIVSLTKSINSLQYLLNPGSFGSIPTTEKLLTGTLRLNTNKQTNFLFVKQLNMTFLNFINNIVCQLVDSPSPAFSKSQVPQVHLLADE